MSRELVRMWIASTIRRLDAALEAERLFDEAAEKRAEATLLVSGELTNNRVSYLARWTGDELVVLQLSPRQQNKLGLRPGTLMGQLGSRSYCRDRPAVRRVMLSDVDIPHAMCQDGWSRLEGTCRFTVDEDEPEPPTGCALCVRYFRPDLVREVVGFSHFERGLARNGKLAFSFEPLFSDQNPHPAQGPTFLFLQFVNAPDWTTLDDCQRVSNVVARVIELV